MKLVINKNQIDSLAEQFLRRAGYAYIRDQRRNKESFVRRLSSGFYPRLHMYTENNGEKIIFDLHLDQKQASYKGSRMHNAEHTGPIVENEIERLKSFIKSSNFIEKENEEKSIEEKIGHGKITGEKINNNKKSFLEDFLNFKMQQSEEIKSRLDIIDVLREYIQLKPAGINFQALCPFHKEKTPSFVVSPEKQIWHCFGCQKGGDIFSFVMEMEGVNFIEALKILANKAGVELKEQNPQITSKRNKIVDILELSKNYYHKILMDNKQSREACLYLKERGLKEDTIKEWKIGYSPDSWDDLIIFLKGRGYKDEEIFSTGMSVKKDGISRFYNRFRDRIMFPINNINGQTVAFSARVNLVKEKEEKMGKYINSPQTFIYDKSKTIFGLDKAKVSIKSEDSVIVVEGQMDVITAHQNGFKNVIASSGTALTGEQIILLKRYTDNISLAFDMDEAGQMAAERGIREAMQQDMDIKVIITPEGKDPDECIKNNPEKWKEAVCSAKNIMQYYFDRTFLKMNLENIHEKREAVKKILPILARLKNNIEQDFWLKKLSQKIDVKEFLLREILFSEKNKEIKNAPKKEYVHENKKKETQTREEKFSELLLALLIKFPDFLNYAINNINFDYIESSNNKTIYKSLIIYYNKIIKEDKELKINYNDFKNFLEEKNSQELKINNFSNNDQIKLLEKLFILGDRDFFEMNDVKAKNEIIKAFLELKKTYLQKRMNDIEKLLINFEKEKENEKIDELMKELKFLNSEMNDI